jgi:hypothetical protein
MAVDKYQFIQSSANAAIKHFAKIILMICWKKETSAQIARQNLIVQRVKTLLKILLQTMDQSIRQLKMVRY